MYVVRESQPKSIYNRKPFSRVNTSYFLTECTAPKIDNEFGQADIKRASNGYRRLDAMSSIVFAVRRPIDVGGEITVAMSRLEASG